MSTTSRLGSRVQPDGSDRRASQPRYRRIVGRLFHALAALWVTGPVPDTQCGFKGFSRAAAHDLFARQQVTSIVFDAEIIHLARRRGYSIAIVPVQWSDKTGSRMRLRAGLAVRVAPRPDTHPADTSPRATPLKAALRVTDARVPSGDILLRPASLVAHRVELADVPARTSRSTGPAPGTLSSTGGIAVRALDLPARLVGRLWLHGAGGLPRVPEPWRRR